MVPSSVLPRNACSQCVCAKRNLPSVRESLPWVAVLFLWAIPGFAVAERNPDCRALADAGPVRLDATGSRPRRGTRATCEMRFVPEPGDAGRWSRRLRRIVFEERDREKSQIG